MGRITDITSQKKKANRVNIFLDGEFALGLDAVTAKKHRLEIGDEIDKEQLELIQFEDECSVAFERAVKNVNSSPKTIRETEKYLFAKGYVEAVVKNVVEKLAEYGFVNDYEYCRLFVKSYSRSCGRYKMEAELTRRGADPDAISLALSELDSQSDEAFAVAEKYIRTHRKADIYKIKNYLRAKGFTGEEIGAAAERIKDEYSFSEEEYD